jgi:hypothetical protein
MAAMSCLELDLTLRDSFDVVSVTASIFFVPEFLRLVVEFVRLVRSRKTGTGESLRVELGLDQIGSIESDGSGRSRGNGLAVTGTNRLRSVTDGSGSIPVFLDRAICSALAGKIFNIPINNGSPIVFDNQVLVDSFILIRGKYSNSELTKH